MDVSKTEWYFMSFLTSIIIIMGINVFIATNIFVWLIPLLVPIIFIIDVVVSRINYASNHIEKCSVCGTYFIWRINGQKKCFKCRKYSKHEDDGFIEKTVIKFKQKHFNSL